MNFRRVTTAQGLLYVGTEVDATPFEIHKRKDGQYDLSVGGEVAGSFARLMDAKAEANRVERQILDELVAKRKTAIEASGIVPGAVVEVKGRRPSEGPVTVKHVSGQGFVELNRPTGGTFRRPVEDLTLVEPAAPVEITEADVARSNAEIDAHNARAAELSIHRGDLVEIAHRNGTWTVSRLAPGRIEAFNENRTITVPVADVLRVLSPVAETIRAEDGTTETLVDVEHADDAKVGDEVILTEDETVWTIKRIQRKADPDYPNQYSIASALFTLRDEAGYRTILRDRADFTRKVWADARKAEALASFTEAARQAREGARSEDPRTDAEREAAAVVRTPEEIVAAGGVTLGDRAEVEGKPGVWTVNRILEAEDGTTLYRLYNSARPVGNRSTWALGEEITLLSDEEAAEEFSEEEIVAERHDSAVRFKPEGEYNARQWPGPIFPKEFGPAVVPNEAEGSKFIEIADKINAARAEVEELAIGDEVVYSGAHGLERWTVVGVRNQGGFVSIEVRERGDSAPRWWTSGELATYVAGGQALLLPTPVDEPGVPDEAGILRLVSDVLLETAPNFHADLASHVEDRQGQPVLVLATRGGHYELYATRVR